MAKTMATWVGGWTAAFALTAWLDGASATPTLLFATVVMNGCAVTLPARYPR